MAHQPIQAVLHHREVTLPNALHRTREAIRAEIRLPVREVIVLQAAAHVRAVAAIHREVAAHLVRVVAEVVHLARVAEAEDK